MEKVLIKVNVKNDSGSWVLGWHTKERVIEGRDRMVPDNELLI